MATLSHELRTPLNAVLGWSHMLLQRTLDEAARERALELIYRNAMIQSQLVSDMLDISRMTAGEIVLDVNLVDLPSLVQSAAETMRPAAVEKGIEIETSLNEAAWVKGDAKRLAQVLNNLLNNAIKFTPRGGRVSVELTRADNETVLVVRDTGPGIRRLPTARVRLLRPGGRVGDARAWRARSRPGDRAAYHRAPRRKRDRRQRPSGTGAIFTARLPALAVKEVI